MPENKIRSFTENDIRAVWHLVSNSKPEILPPDWPTSLTELRRVALLHPRSTPGGSLVAEIDGKITGCLLFHSYQEEGTALICLVAVLQEAQRTGVGRVLMDAWEEAARAQGLRRLYAPETPAQDISFITFAEKFGMRRVGVIVAYQRRAEGIAPPPEDEHIVPIATVSLSEVTDAFNECFPQTPRNQDDLHALIIGSRWGPWASLAYVEGQRVMAFLFTSDRGGRPYLQYVGTRPEARRRGAAVLLLRHALYILQQGGAGEVECEVFEDNERAARLAESVGLKPGRRRIAFEKLLT